MVVTWTMEDAVQAAVLVLKAKVIVRIMTSVAWVWCVARITASSLEISFIRKMIVV